MEIRGKTILVTGGGRGLGAALGSELARRGARVVLVARHPQAVEGVAAEIRARGGEAHALTADVGDKNAIYPLVGAAAAAAGPIDILIHNASTLGALPLRELADTECEDFGAVLETNLLGPFRLTKAVVGSMLVRGGGLVIGITSDASVNGYPTWGAYGVSKAALDQLFRRGHLSEDVGGDRELQARTGQARPVEGRKVLSLARVGRVRQRERVAGAAVEGVAKVKDLAASSLSLTASHVLSDLPVERGLERVLDAAEPQRDRRDAADRRGGFEVHRRQPGRSHGRGRERRTNPDTQGQADADTQGRGPRHRGR